METTSTPPDSKLDPKRRALGKGIESLLGPRPVAAPAQEAAGKPLEIELDRIDRNPNQTRSSFDDAKLQELAASIAASGVVQPIVVRELPEGRFQLITGERRWRASRLAGKATVPAIVRQVSDEQAMEMTIVENLQRADLNPMEQARAYEKLSYLFRMTQEQMSTRTGKDRASIGNFLRLLKLPKSVQARVEAGDLSFGHARALLSLGSQEEVIEVAEKIVSLSLSVRQTEGMVQMLINPEPPPDKEKRKAAAAEAQDPNVREAQNRLQRSLGLKVRIEDRFGQGRVIIEYGGVDDFDSLLARLGAE